MYSILAIVQTSRTGWSQWLSISLKLLIRVQRAADTADWVVQTADVAERKQGVLAAGNKKHIQLFGSQINDIIPSINRSSKKEVTGILISSSNSYLSLFFFFFQEDEAVLLLLALKCRFLPANFVMPQILRPKGLDVCVCV